MSTVETILSILKGHRLPLQNEKELQAKIKYILMNSPLIVDPEHRLDPENIIDFLINGSVGIEVKIKGSKKQIYRQCERYAYFSTIQSIVLITNKSVGFPQDINGKPCFVVNLGKAWL
jgi:hypothetical protein